MKKIGILGGMSPESTTLYYEHITRTYTARFGNYGYPEILIYSVNFQKYVDWQHSGQWQEAARDMAEALERLHGAGADFGLIATNTMHIVFEEVQRAVHMPLISIVQATAECHSRGRASLRGLAGDSIHDERAILPRWPRASGNHSACSRAREPAADERSDLPGIVPRRDPAGVATAVSGHHRASARPGRSGDCARMHGDTRCWSSLSTAICPSSTLRCCTPPRHWISRCNRRSKHAKNPCRIGQ